MNRHPRTASIFSIVLGVATGIALVLVAGAFLLFSSKSPLRSHDASFIDGFTLGVGFVFYLFAALWCFVGAAGSWKRRVAGIRPAR